jgi:hypothetical protein
MHSATNDASAAGSADNNPSAKHKAKKKTSDTGAAVDNSAQGQNGGK